MGMMICFRTNLRIVVYAHRFCHSPDGALSSNAISVAIPHPQIGKNMKNVFLFALLIVVALPARAQDLEIKNLTSKEYQKKFDQLVQQGFRPVKVWSKTLGVFDGEASFGYWATFRKVPNSPAWVARHGIDAVGYQNEFNKWVGEGYMPTDINVACVNQAVRYCVIYEKIPNPKPWIARHNIKQSEYDATQKDLLAKGYKLKLRSYCRTPSGFVFAALWNKE